VCHWSLDEVELILSVYVNGKSECSIFIYGGWPHIWVNRGEWFWYERHKDLVYHYHLMFTVPSLSYTLIDKHNGLFIIVCCTFDNTKMVDEWTVIEIRWCKVFMSDYWSKLEMSNTRERERERETERVEFVYSSLK